MAPYSHFFRLVVTLTLLLNIGGFSQFSLMAIAADIDHKPGKYRLLFNHDANVCAKVEKIANSSSGFIYPPPIAKLPDAFKWTAVDAVAEEFIDPRDVLYAFGDINGDGAQEIIFKTRLSVRGVMDESLSILEKERGQPLLKRPISLKYLFENGTAISFTETQKLISRAKVLYGDSREALGSHLYLGASKIKIVRFDGKPILLAWDVHISNNALPKIYVFRLSPKFDVEDLCLLGRVCSCKGCADFAEARFLDMEASAEWCARKQ